MTKAFSIHSEEKLYKTGRSIKIIKRGTLKKLTKSDMDMLLKTLVQSDVKKYVKVFRNLFKDYYTGLITKTQMEQQMIIYMTRILKKIQPSESKFVN